MSQKTDYTAWHQSQPDIGLDEAIEKIEGGGRMSKRIVIVERCTDCPHYIHALTPDGLLEGHLCMFDGIEPNPVDGVPDNCPLPPIPKRNRGIASWVIGQAQKTDEDVEYWRGYARGWDSCLDEIEGGNEDEPANNRD